MKSVLFSLEFALIRPRAANRYDLTSLIQILAQKVHTNTLTPSTTRPYVARHKALHNNTSICRVSAGTRALHRTGAWLERWRLPLMANPQDVSRPQWPTVVRNLLMEPKWVCERHDVALWTKEYWVYSCKCARAVCLVRTAAGEDERHLCKSTVLLIWLFVAVLQRHWFVCMTKTNHP